MNIADVVPGGILPTDWLFWSGSDELCSRCHEEIGEREVPIMFWPAADAGHSMYRYCQRCTHDPDSDRCRVCGCTERQPCDRVCGWKAPGLCTECHEPVRQVYIASGGGLSVAIEADIWQTAAELGEAQLHAIADELAFRPRRLRVTELQRRGPLVGPGKVPLWIVAAARCECCERFVIAGEEDYACLEGGGVLCESCDRELSAACECLELGHLCDACAPGLEAELEAFEDGGE